MKLAFSTARLLTVATPLLALATAQPLGAVPQKLKLVEDIQSIDNGVDYPEITPVEVGGWTYFVRDVDDLGTELYRSQGTTSIVELVKDILPGPGGSRPELLTEYNGELVFYADDGTHGYELWKSDGTAAGTQLVLDIMPGIRGSVDLYLHDRRPIPQAGGLLFFSASGASGRVLYKSDGTTAGTQIATTLPFSNPNIGNHFTEFGGEIYYRGVGGTFWKASGGGATQIFSFAGGPNGIVAMGGELFFQASWPSTTGYELWKSDGTAAGTVLVKDIYPGTTVNQSSYPSLLTAVGSQLFFAANDGVSGKELWVTDGTTAGTTMVKDINPGPSGSIGDHIYRQMSNFGGKVWFAASSGPGATLWSSDGTSAGTQPILSPGFGTPTLKLLGSIPTGDIPGPTLYFSGATADGRELWKTDGTAGGTSQVIDLVPGFESSSPRGIVTDSTGGAFFLSDSGSGSNLHYTDGTAAGTSEIADQAATTLPVTGNSNPMGVMDVAGRLYFAANDGVFGNELWTSDGDETERLGDFNPGPFSAFNTGDPEYAADVPLRAEAVGGQLFMTAYSSGTSGIQLWRSDGSVAGTEMLYDFNETSIYGWQFHGVSLGDRLMFGARINSTAWGLWRSNGTAGGTQFLAPMVNQPLEFARVGNEAYFFVYGPSRLWKTDGTVGGETIVHEFGAGESFLYSTLTPLGNQVLFAVESPGTGWEVWKSDGTSAGTAILKDINPGSADSDPAELTRVGDTVYFSADDGVNGRELWRTDGTEAGTTLVGNVSPAASDSDPENLTAVGDRLFFLAHDLGTYGIYAYEDPNLVLSGTFSVLPDVDWMRAVGSRRVFFQANDGFGGVGTELYTSDGTPGGMTLYEDFLPGSAYAKPAEIVLSGGTMFVAATEYAKGMELRAAHVGATSQAIGEGCAASGLLPELFAYDPVLGGTSEITLGGANPSLPLIAFLGSTVGAPVNLGDGCHAFLDPASVITFLSAVTDSEGSWKSPAIPIPASAALNGLQLALQAIVGPTATSPLGFDLSNGVLLTLGD